ncbi:MAG TPA: hypothetical protein VGH81_04070 [Rudaea sp.]
MVALLLIASAATPPARAGGDDDDKPSGAAAGALPTLSVEQQRAAGIVVAHPLSADVPQREDATGLVLDPVDLIAESGEAEAAAAAARAAVAETERVRGLYGAGAGASLKTLQGAQAEQARTHAHADAAAAKFQAHWRPIAELPPAVRQKLIDDAAAGTALLLRADLPGRHILGIAPDRALVDADGVNVPGKVLGPLAHRADEGQGVGILVELRNAPAGLGAGARLPVTLLAAKRSGMLVPRDAVLYDDGGALVYKQLTAKPGDKQMRYDPVRVRLLQSHGDGWLVDGIDDDDNIVVHGAGVLWSLQGIIGHAAGDIDDDD